MKTDKPTRAEEILEEHKLCPEDMSHYKIWDYVIEAMEQYGNLRFAEGRAISLDKNLNWENKPTKTAEEILEKEFPLAIIDEDEWTGGVLKIMEQYRTEGLREVLIKYVMKSLKLNKDESFIAEVDVDEYLKQKGLPL